MSGQEGTLFVRRLAKPHLVARAVDVLFLKGLGRHPDELRGSPQVFLGEVDVSILVAAVDATALASEPERVQD
jgi:hypothetical protein